MTRHPSALDWSRRLAGDARGWWRERRMRRHLAGCEACRRLEAEMISERIAFDAAPERREELARLQARAATALRHAAPSSALGLPGLRWALGAGLGLALVAVLALRLPEPRDGLLEKGGSALALYVDRPGGAVALPARCAPGDRLMARWRTDRPWLLLLERDGAGRVQVLLPAGGTTSVRLQAGEGTTPQSFVLDDTPGRECFAAFFSDEPLDAAAAGRALAGAPGAPALPGASVRVQCCEKGGAR